MKKLLIAAIFSFIANLGYSQYVHDLFPCRDSTGTRVEGCFAWSDSSGQYIQVTDTMYCNEDTLFTNYEAVNTAWGYDQGEIVMRDTLVGGCNTNVDTTSLSNRIDVNEQAIIDTAAQVRADFPTTPTLQEVTDAGATTTNTIEVGGLDISTINADSDNSATSILVHDNITNAVEGKSIGENEIVYGTANGGVESSSNLAFDASTVPSHGDVFVYDSGTGLFEPQTRSYGEMYVVDSDPDTISVTAGVQKKGTGNTSGQLNEFTYSSGRLTYTGSKTKMFLFNTSVSFTHSVNNTIIHFLIYKNGSGVLKSKAEQLVGSANDEGNVGNTSIIELAQNDYIELFYEADKTGDIIVYYSNINITEI